MNYEISGDPQSKRQINRSIYVDSQKMHRETISDSCEIKTHYTLEQKKTKLFSDNISNTSPFGTKMRTKRTHFERARKKSPICYEKSER
jgi:hypothetical protein